MSIPCDCFWKKWRCRCSIFRSVAPLFVRNSLDFTDIKENTKRIYAEMSTRAYMAFSWLIYMTGRWFACIVQAMHRGEDGQERVGGGERRAGLGWQTKGATRRCRDGASAFTVAGGHERGGDRKVRGDGEPPSILQRHAGACAHTYTHTTAYIEMSSP